MDIKKERKINMKREIKFRMWSKDVNKFWYDPENVFDCLKFSQMPEHKGLYDDMVWQQYTGLEDKNGVEIYEGDIIFCEKHYGIKNRVGIVDYFASSFIIDWRNQTDDLLDEVCPDFEVIGNIFEHRELLK
jgi:uncharacterized phage protein (TIGR01671 family)